ncbi:MULTISPECIES: XkdX family protein [unclassified Clostridioides]|nr:XkdX family protein [Clostridioides sp. ES-W-0018-02]MCC0705407.1 XkdX family protein [Clostridioides sp. ES-S-0049-02]MCC0713466.1 XkdX family protein [Clostridioides sp. ES-W-0017-02]MCC0764274.1 XkdX family protein [Clostridioides sp. ES-S-0006-03]
MLNYDKIKYYYDNKMWTKEMVKNSVGKNKITEVEYREITGEDYIG